jgi:lysophospholipase L1-like esterase
MRNLIVLLLLSFHLTTASWCFSEEADAPLPRAKEYNWMSIKAWNDKHERFVARTKKGDVPLLFVGDSITEGWGGKGKAAWEKHYAPLGAVNYGIGGDTTQNILWRMANGEADGIAPKAIVLMIGTNNFGLSGHQPDQVIKGITAVVNDLRTRFPTAKILLLGIFPRDEKPGTNNRTRITTVNTAIATLADGNAIHYLDIGHHFLEPDGTLSKDIMPDFLHLSETGYQRWATAIQDPLTKLMQ